MLQHLRYSEWNSPLPNSTDISLEREIEREHPKSRTHQNVVNRITVPNLDLSIFTNSPTTVSEKDWVVGVWSLRTTESKLIKKKYEGNGNRDWWRDKIWKPLRGLAGCVRLGVFEQWIRQICFFFLWFPSNYTPDSRMSSANRNGNEKEMEWQRKKMTHQDIMSIRQC